MILFYFYFFEPVVCHNSIKARWFFFSFGNVKKFWKLKMKALKAYRQEIRPRPHSRSFDGIENLAKIRGNQSGQSFTESFQMLREIKR